MSKHIRRLSTTITSNIQASAHTIAEAGQEAVTNAVQHILHYDQLPDWMKADPYISKLCFRSFFASMGLLRLPGRKTCKICCGSQPLLRLVARLN